MMIPKPTRARKTVTKRIGSIRGRAKPSTARALSDPLGRVAAKGGGRGQGCGAARARVRRMRVSHREVVRQVRGVRRVRVGFPRGAAAAAPPLRGGGPPPRGPPRGAPPPPPPPPNRIAAPPRAPA